MIIDPLQLSPYLVGTTRISITHDGATTTGLLTKLVVNVRYIPREELAHRPGAKDGRLRVWNDSYVVVGTTKVHLGENDHIKLEDD